jgi:hypothetical protein
LPSSTSFESADEDHDGAAVGHRFADEFAAQAAGLVVVHANVEEAFALGGVGIMGDEFRAFGRLIQ